MVLLQLFLRHNKKSSTLRMFSLLLNFHVLRNSLKSFLIVANKYASD
jgi:hypothetical protein